MVRVHPRLETERLKLRPFVADDAARLAELAGAREIADTLVSIPHPLSLSLARSIIAGNAAGFQAGRSLHFAVERRQAPGLIGSVELHDVDAEHSQAELGFWVAVSEWGQGIASEAALAVVRYGLASLGLNRIYAHHLVRNPACATVLVRIGMKQEGVLRERVRHWGVFEDVAVYGLLRSDLPSIPGP